MLGKRNLIIILLAIVLPSILPAQTAARNDYINRFRKIAISEMERTGIPASIKLAQGILESGDGKSTLARKAKNHFGIKCHSTWNGKTHYIEDDDYDDNGKLIKSCFRVYKNADASYIAHSEFLRDPKKKYRYGFLFSLPSTDYKSWARGLKQAGYATSPTYAEKLIRIIEGSELYRFDEMGITGVAAGEKTEAEIKRLNIKTVNDVKITVAEEGETVVDIAERTEKSVERILKYNEKLTRKNQQIEKGTRVFLQRKRNNSRGKKKWHFVKKGETMFDISQRYGVSLEKLRHKNRIPNRAEPAVGEKIKIRGWFKVGKNERPQTRKRSDLFEEEEELRNEEEEKINDEDFIEIEIPTSNSDDEEFDEDIVPETPDSEIFDEPIFEEETGSGETETPNTNTNTGTNTNTNSGNTNTNPQNDQPTTGVYYSAVKGDTLFSISRKYGTTVEAIKRLNNLTNNTISIGQRLRIF